MTATLNTPIRLIQAARQANNETGWGACLDMDKGVGYPLARCAHANSR
jgi:hypothetical protein